MNQIEHKINHIIFNLNKILHTAKDGIVIINNNKAFKEQSKNEIDIICRELFNECFNIDTGLSALDYFIFLLICKCTKIYYSKRESKTSLYDQYSKDCKGTNTIEKSYASCCAVHTRCWVNGLNHLSTSCDIQEFEDIIQTYIYYLKALIDKSDTISIITSRMTLPIESIFKGHLYSQSAILVVLNMYSQAFVSARNSIDMFKQMNKMNNQIQSINNDTVELQECVIQLQDNEAIIINDLNDINSEVNPSKVKYDYKLLQLKIAPIKKELLITQRIFNRIIKQKINAEKPYAILIDSEVKSDN